MYLQISDAIRDRIRSGDLATNSQLPSSRSLCTDLGISRTSVVTAYEQLQAEGYITSKPGSGFRVNAIGDIGPVQQSLEDVKEAKEPSTTVSKFVLDPGKADMRLFPYRQWSKSIAQVARLTPHAMVESNDKFGDPEFRKSIARYLFDWRGITASIDQIMITAGSTEALEICARILISSGDSIGLENPGYLPLRSFVSNLRINTQWLPIDDQGAMVPKNTAAKIAIITPSHQYPLGRPMTPSRRSEFINWAKKTSAWIIEDDYDSEFRYSGRPIPALSSIDHLHRSIYIGSFAKIFSVGLRLGFIVIPNCLVDRFRQELEGYTPKAAVPMQRPLSRFIDNGEFYRHIRRVRRIYSDRRDLLLAMLSRQLGDLISYDDHKAGMHLTIYLLNGMDDQKIAYIAKHKGLSVVPLSIHYKRKAAVQGLLIGFCPFNEQEIISNVQILKDVIEGTT